MKKKRKTTGMMYCPFTEREKRCGKSFGVIPSKVNASKQPSLTANHILNGADEKPIQGEHPIYMEIMRDLGQEPVRPEFS